MVIALLIYAFTTESVGNNSKVSCPTSCWQKTDSYQKESFQDILEQLFHFYACQTCEIGHADAIHIPGDKIFLLPVFYLKEHKNSPAPPNASQLHLPHYFYDPITHYIYALRRIVI